jgi:photosystem II stability/assembly factor-like uncharacterized protein
MKKSRTPLWLSLATVLIVFLLFMEINHHPKETIIAPSDPHSTERESKFLALDYYQQMYANPQTGEMGRPSPRAQSHWLRMIENQNKVTRGDGDDIEWVEVGPTNVGGRTRAIAIDSQDPQRLIAGGVRGGFWISENYGDRWNHVKGITENESITHIEQHPNNPNIWYASTGEYVGSGANFFGGGILYSEDNGNQWDIKHYEYRYDSLLNDHTYQSISDFPISSAPSQDSREGTPFQYSSRMLVHPDSNSIFVATHEWGILKSTDGIKSFVHNLPPNPERFERQQLPMDSSTTLLLRFEDSLKGAQGDMALDSSEIDFRNGVFGQGAYMDAIDFLRFSSEDNINANAGTVEFWIQPDEVGNSGKDHLFLEFGEYPFLISLRRIGNWVEILVITGEDSNLWYGAGSSIDDWKEGEWHHLAFTWNANAIATYIDGDQVAIATPIVPLPEIDKDFFQIGVPTGDGIGGVIDELRISDRARTATEINQSYQFGTMEPVGVTYPSFRPDFSDVSIGPDGDLLAYLSGLKSDGSGVYRSTDNGNTWKDITPGDWPDFVMRGIIEHAPSNPDVAYLLLLQPGGQMSFYKFDLENEEYENRSQNLPTEGVIPANYYFVMNVKPDDENLIVIGGIHLFRSIDAFANPISDPTINYIQNFMHVDNHLIYYNPYNPDEVWAVNDGGIYFSDDITRISGNYDNVRWQDKDNNYNVTQFYSVGQSNDSTDHRVFGGAQDNGYLQVYPPDPKQTWRAFGEDFGSDGAYVYVTPDYTYMSFQLGETYRLDRGPDGDADFEHGWIGISPPGATGRDFIHQWAVDPMEENTMYYPINNRLYRVDNIDQTPMNTFYGEENFDLISDGDQNGHEKITALAVTTEPAHTLLFASSGEKPIIKRVKNANTDDFVVEDVSIHDAAVGYIQPRCIAPNPADGDEWLVVFTNYDVPGLYHTSDGGQSYQLVEGNLAGTNDIPGPSMEWADILNFEGEKYYFLATHIGIFMTQVLDGTNTQWTHMGTDVMGYALALMVQARESDGKIVVGTHGRGFFAGYLTEPVTTSIPEENLTSFDLQVSPNPVSDQVGLFFTLESSEKLSVQVFDLGGKLVMQKPTKTYVAGEHNVDLSFEGLPSGMYLIGLKGQTSYATEKVMKY